MPTVIANWQQDMVYHAEVPGGSLALDAGEDFGGTGGGVRSKALMLTALAGCTGMDVASLIKKMRLTVNAVKIEVSAELTDEHPKIYKDVRVKYHFKTQDDIDEKLEKIVSKSFDQYCGVIEMFKQFSDVSKEIIIER